MAEACFEVVSVLNLTRCSKLSFSAGYHTVSFLRISDTTSAPTLSHFIEKYWRLRRPDVLISVTGSAASLQLTSLLQRVFDRGLAAAAAMTNAWIFTGGVRPRCSHARPHHTLPFVPSCRALCCLDQRPRAPPSDDCAPPSGDRALLGGACARPEAQYSAPMAAGGGEGLRVGGGTRTLLS